MKKQFVALARVSSREQEREGFSLEVQEESLYRYADQKDGEICKFFRIAETATKPDERRMFKELLEYVRRNAIKLAGLLFFKVDRAARNLFDYVELERLETDYGVPVIYITQPTENTPAGRMMRRTLANMASFYTEQQSLDVKDGLVRRIHEGLFVGKSPYGYQNVRHEGRSLVEIHPEHGCKIPQIFELYAYHNHSIDSLLQHLLDVGINYTDPAPKFTRSKLHSILRDRAYIGELQFHGEWYPGRHDPLVDRTTFDRVQVRLGDQVYQSHDLLYGSERIVCGHCGHPVTGEIKTKNTKQGPKHYVYYRCSRYTRKGHPRIRVREAELDQQVIQLFDRFRIKDDGVREWFGQVIKARSAHRQESSQQQSTELKRQLTSLRNKQDRLLNLRLDDEIDEPTYASKSRELRDRIANLESQLASTEQPTSEYSQLAEKAFELSQTLQEKWLTADLQQKRQLLDITCLNFSLDDVTLVPEIRKPFDVLAERQLVLSSRGDRRLTFPNDCAGTSLLWHALSQTYAFNAVTFASLGAGGITH